ncbi:uncharacterized protein LOC132750447 [Ruditapes philippinarum]|uniref:uncharacterized protein LOC132750447 n=1 Tax=Ruditapes philippinarum TaxID=129788 RepID=UPI00295A68A9|nr:uncharacterized protein LOC132750447 [Ruditapes philippinarum]
MSCCIFSNILKRSFELSFEIDVCRYVLELQIESYKSTLLLDTSELGDWKFFTLQGLLKISYRMIDVFEDNIFIIDATVKLCLSDSESCVVDIPILQRKVVTKPFCQSEIGFQIPDFSLAKWLEDQGSNSAVSVLPKDIVSKLLDDLHISKFLSLGRCTASNPAWKSDCEFVKSEVVLPPGLSCSLDNSCKNIACCVEFAQLQLMLAFSFNFDVCNLEFTTRIEDITKTESILKFSFNTEHIMDLYGILKLKYKIFELKGAGLFSIDVNYRMCLDALNCTTETSVFNNLQIPKSACDWNSSMIYESVEDFFQVIDISTADVLQGEIIDMFLHKTGLNIFMSDEPCVLSSLAITTFEHEQKCSTIQVPVGMENKMTCVYDESCTSMTCCLNAEFIQRTISFGFKINTCAKKLNIYIESLQYDYEFTDDMYGREHTISLKGIIDLKTKFDFISVTNVLVINVGVKLCWDKSSCVIDAMLLDGVKLYVPLCDWDSNILINGFSLLNWKADNGLGSADNIDGLLSDQLFEHLQLAQYLGAQCDTDDFGSSITPTDCALGLPSWFDDNAELQCGFQNSCSNISCCLMMKPLGRSFTINVDIQPCEFQISISIEKFKKVVSLNDYQWDASERVTLIGMLSVTYAIVDVTAENAYVVTLKLSLCLDESDCLFDDTVLDNQMIKKETCHWEDYSLPSEFSLSEWAENRGLDPSQLFQDGTQYLMEKLAIDRFLLQPSCSLRDNIYLNDVVSSGCSHVDTFTSLLPIAACRLSDECLNLECCIDPPNINRRFKVQFKFDPCNYKYEVNIEKLTFENSLFDVDLSTEKTFSLHGVVTIRYQVEDFAVDNIYKVNLGIKICLDVVTCPVDEQVLDNALITKPTCFTKLKQDYKIKEFSLNKWMDRYNTSFSKNVQLMLMSDLGITDYLNNDECTIGQVGWNKDKCALSLSLLEQQLFDMSCSLSAKCTEFSCCVPVPFINRNVGIDVNVDPCALTMDISVERLRYSFSLIDYNFGRPEYVWLSGVLRLTFTIHDIAQKNEYLLSVNFEECWEYNDVCSKEYSILTNQRLPKQICNSTSGFNIPGSRKMGTTLIERSRDGKEE